MKKSIFALGILLFIPIISCVKDMAPDQQMEEKVGEVILVGTNKKNITPPEGQGITMSGYSGRKGHFDGIHDSLFVRTIIISDQDDNSSAIHCSVDQLNFSSGHFYHIYNRIIAEIPGLENLPISNLFISATHTHGGPSTGNLINIEQRNEAVFQSIKGAFQNRQASRMRIGKTTINDVNSNRQNPHKGFNGNFVCPLEVFPSGNSDKEAHFVEFINSDEKSIASMITFGVHSTVMGQHNTKITGDLAGYASRYIENNTGNGHVSLFLYTGGGDQSPVERTQNGSQIDNPKTGVKAFGDRLGSQILPAFSSGIFLDDIKISSIALPVVLERDYQPQDNIPDTTETRGIFGIRYSDNFVIVSTPFELFSSTAQELKQSSPFEYSIILSLTNGVGHYIPPDSTYNHEPNPDDPQGKNLYIDHQCYENRTSIFTSSAEQTLKEACLQMLQELL